MLYDSTAKIATTAMSREIFLVFGNTRFSHRRQRCNTVTVIFLGDLPTLSHILFLQFLLTSALATARNDGKGMESPSRLRYSRKYPFPPHVISSGASMLYDSTAKIATAAMSREIFLVFGNTRFSHQRQRCNTVIVIFLGDFSTLSHILSLQFLLTSALATARNDGKGMESPSRLQYSRKCPFPPHVISSGASILYDSTAKIATATMSREIFLVFRNTRFSHRRQRCNTVTVIFLGDLPTLSHILFLQFLLTSALATARDDESGIVNFFRK
jgi:hypothetical protein